MDAAYAIIGLPLLGALVLIVAGRRLGEPLAGWVVTALGAGSFVAAVYTWATLLGRPAAHRSAVLRIFTWIPVGGLHVDMALQVDPLSMTMALFVTGISSVIFLYSIGYLHADPGFWRFFFYLSLFLFSMVVLILSDNFLFMFLGWEGVGFCSYGLIGFWFDRERAAVAAKKAFVTNRVGDFGFIVALLIMFGHFHSFNFSAVLGPLASGHATLAHSTATFLGMMLVLGAVGKSAQIPLYMWLPDAMEGPTPISALIHAATMVTAGAYLIARSAPILHFTPSTQLLIACLGVATAFIASTIACAEDDIKRILAYSTLAEIGLMFLSEGSGSYGNGIFLMVTHAFFKALLFLGAGSVIHALRDEQNVKRMGGLARYLPITFPTFIIGYLALSAIPPFSGWWSHEAVLETAWAKSPGLWITGVAVDGLTAYYMTRQVMLVFFGKARWREQRPAHAAAEHGGHAEHEEHAERPHESPWVMWVPLVLLSIGALAGGLLDFPALHWDFINRFLAPVFPTAIAPHETITTATKWYIGVAGTAVNFVGLGAGLVLWRRRVERPELEPAFLRHGWYIDEGVAAAVSGPLATMAAGTAFGVDARLVDGGVNGVARLTAAAGRQLRRIQTGYVRTYALGIGAGAVAILIYVAARVGS